MAGKFDPDAFLAATEPKAAGGFDPDAFLAQTAPEPEGDATKAGLLHGAQSLLQGFGDEIQGVGGGLESLLSGRGFESGYKSQRDSLRGELKALEESNPDASMVGKVGGTVASAFAPGMGAASVGKMAALGGVAGLGYSEADLTKGDVGGAALDTALGAGIGGALGGVAKGVGWGAEKIAGKVGNKLGSIREGVATKKAADLAAQEKSLAGALGGESQAGQRMVENLGRLQPDMPPDQLQALKVLEDAGIIPGLKQKLGASTLERLPGQAGKIDAAESALQSFRSSKPQLLEEGIEEALSSDTAKQQVMDRVKRYAPNLVGGALGMGVGGAAGEGWGGLAGAGIGASFGSNYRPMIQAVMRMAKNPAVQTRGLSALRSTATGTAGLLGGTAKLAGRSAEGHIAAQNYSRMFPKLSESLALEDEEQDPLAQR